jgi:hypothetical protein
MQDPDLKYTEDQMSYLREGVIEGIRRVVKMEQETNAKIRSNMVDTSILCLSETHDNLLMWSHYAQNHTGAVIKFLSLPEVDSPLIVAQPVRYTEQVPRLTFASLMEYDESLDDIVQLITLTKGKIWAYEKEWRIVASTRNKTQSYEIVPFAPDEVGAVYLGCNIAKDDKAEIMEITRIRYSKATIFQAEKHEREFSLIFREIT